MAFVVLQEWKSIIIFVKKTYFAMINTLPILSILGFGCNDSTRSQGHEAEEIADSVSSANSSEQDDEALLIPFKAVIDTLNSVGEPFVHSEYFLADISNDGVPELWIVNGSCEADKKLWVYLAVDGTVRKILSTSGGHTMFYRNEDHIRSMTGSTGCGYSSTYTYKNNTIEFESVEFNSFELVEIEEVNNEEDNQKDISEYIQLNRLK
ncbi:MAG: hypothetical protein NC339_06750 [Muribaculaceae bacterium]|nr:hypothetical protein [Muribaculaceae bacterium]